MIIFLIIWLFTTSIESDHVGMNIVNGEALKQSSGPCTVLNFGHVISYPKYVRRAMIEIDFRTIDAVRIHTTVILTYNLDPESAPAFYNAFRHDSLDAFESTTLKDIVRRAFFNAAPNYGYENISKNNAEIVANVLPNIQSPLKPYGIHVLQLNVLSMIPER